MTREAALEKWNMLKSMGWKPCANRVHRGIL